MAVLNCPLRNAGTPCKHRTRTRHSSTRSMLSNAVQPRLVVTSSLRRRCVLGSAGLSAASAVGPTGPGCDASPRRRALRPYLAFSYAPLRLHETIKFGETKSETDGNMMLAGPPTPTETLTRPSLLLALADMSLPPLHTEKLICFFCSAPLPQKPVKWVVEV